MVFASGNSPMVATPLEGFTPASVTRSEGERLARAALCLLTSPKSAVRSGERSLVASPSKGFCSRARSTCVGNFP